MRKTCLDMIFELAQRDERIVFVGSDLGAATLSQFRERLPERFFMEGIAEGHVVGMAAGLALEGRVVYVNTIETFLTRRCFEQVVLDVCLHNLPVRFIGNGGGLVYAPLGPTHLATEDLSILRAIPNLTIVAPADAEEMRRLMPLTPDHPGPLFIRLAKGYDPVVSRGDLPFAIGRAVPMVEGRDALILTTGITLRLGLEAARILAEQGLETAVLHLPTVKPLDVEAILARAEMAPVIVSVEENTVLGGFGGAIAEILAEAGFDRPWRFKRLGLPDAFPDRYGSQAQLLEHYGLTGPRIAQTVLQLRAQTGKD